MTAASGRIADLKIDDSHREANKPPRLALFLLSVVLVVLAAVVVWWLRPEPGPEVTLVTVTSTSMSGAAPQATVLDASGYVTARLRATISSKVTGKVVEVLVDEGLRVEKGQVLARLDDSMATRQVALSESQITASRSALAESEVRLEEARIELGRIRKLVEAEVSTAAALDTGVAQVDALEARVEKSRDDIAVAERQLELRRQELSDLVIRAPFSGVVVSKDAQPGEMISPVSAGGGFTRTGICTLVDMSSLEIEVDVNEAYINRVKPDQKVVATLDAYQDWKIPASVITSVPTADRQKATVRVRIAFDELDPRILPDMGVKVSFLGDEAAEQPEVGGAPRSALRVPATAVRQDGGRDIVFVHSGASKGEAVERRAVTLGGQAGQLVEVVAGVRNGERVVVDPPTGLSDGDVVTVVSPG